MIAKLIQNIVSAGVQESLDNERARKIVVLNLFSFIGIASMLYFGINALFFANYLHACILFITIAITIANYFYLRKSKNYIISGHIIIVMMFALNLYLIFSGGQDNTGILWLYVFPVLCIFTLGIKQGLIYVGVLFGIVLGFLYSNFTVMPEYSINMRARFIASFTAVTFMSLVFEHLRAITYRELQKHKQNLEKIVTQRTIALQNAKEKAEESDRLKSAFLANMSHEIRTPMNAIVGFTNLIVSSDTDPALKKDMASHIIANSNSLIQLIEDIIDISKIDSKQFALNISKIDLRKSLNIMVADYKERMIFSGKKHLKLIANLPPGNQPIYINGDISRLNQIIGHLLDNAIKFTDEGQIEVGMLPIRDNTVEFYIRDTGIGFSKEEGARIFDRFITGRTSRQRIYRGTGLGLSIVKSLVDLMEGKIWYESKKQMGSTFYFSIQTDLKPSTQNAPNYSITKIQANFKNLTLLIADDEVINYDCLAKMLAPTQATILYAENGKKAIEMLDKYDIDIILMDITMPVMNGLEATKIIRRAGKKVPIIAQTAFTLEMEEKVRVESGCDAYISKPIDKQKLLMLISELTQNRFDM